jgi:hypothetical protein
MDAPRRTVVFLLIFWVSWTLSAAEFFVSPTGSATGTGSAALPWNLQTALNHPAAVRPGDTIWLRGGTYTGNFVNRLNGTAAAPIIVRNYNQESAKLTSPSGTTLAVYGNYTWIWGLEVTQSGTDYTDGVDIHSGAGHKLINCVIHNTGCLAMYVASDALNTEIYGTLTYFNGTAMHTTGKGGYGIYTQNITGEKFLTDNIFVNDLGNYPIHIYTQDGGINNFRLSGNVVATGSPAGRWLLIGGGQKALNPILKENTIYNVGVDIGYQCFGAAARDAVIQSNDIITNYVRPFNLHPACENTSITTNRVYGDNVGFTQSQYPNNTYYPARPAGQWIRVRPNKYESGRAHIIVFSWSGLATAAVDLSLGGLNAGETYEIRDSQNFFGPVITSGTYAGGTVSLPLAGLTLAVPRNVPAVASAPVHTTSEFNTFVMIKKGVAVPQVATPTFSPNGGTFTGSVSVSLSTTTTGATIRYTTNGSTPTSTSNVYSTPFALLSTTTLKARAFKTGMTDSGTATAVFTINHAPVVTSAAIATPNPALVGQSVSLSVAASDSEGDALTTTWTLGDGTTRTGASIQHVYATAGTYPAKATITDGKGGSATSSVSVTINSVVSSYVARINFQPAYAPVPVEYQMDTGAVFSAARGYGWNQRLGSRKRNVNPDQRLDTLVYSSTPATWTYKIPNGTYLVTFACGDAGYIHTAQRVVLQGTVMIDNVRTERNKFITVTDAPVTVANGELKITIGSGIGSTTLNYVDIKTAVLAEGQPAETTMAPATIGLETYQAPRDMAIGALSISTTYATDHGKAQFKSVLDLPADFSPGGVPVTVDVCGAVATFNLDQRGHGKGSEGVIALKKTKAGWSLSVSLKNIVWPDQWTEAGIDDWKSFKGSAAVPVSATVGTYAFSATKETYFVTSRMKIQGR